MKTTNNKIENTAAILWLAAVAAVYSIKEIFKETK